MSTRCNIIVRRSDENFTVIYHHFDGYPDGVGKELPKILSDFEITEETTPIILSQYIQSIDREYEHEPYAQNVHGDIEYVYIIDLNKSILKCYSIYFDYSDNRDIVKIMHGDESRQRLIFEEKIGKYNTEIDYKEKYYALLDELKEIKNSIGSLQNQITNVVNEYLF
jgi:hypothetical protein